jgi:hypothetical protein
MLQLGPVFPDTPGSAREVRVQKQARKCQFSTKDGPFPADIDSVGSRPDFRWSGPLRKGTAGRSLKFVVAQQMRMLISRHLCAKSPPAPNRE